MSARAPYTRFNIVLPTALLTDLDAAATQHYHTRSEYVRHLVVGELRRLRQHALVEPTTLNSEQLETAYLALQKERARRIASRELKKMRRQLRAGTFKYED